MWISSGVISSRWSVTSQHLSVDFQPFLSCSQSLTGCTCCVSICYCFFVFFFFFSLLLSVAETRAWIQLHVQMWNKMTIKVLFILTFNLDLWVPAFSLPLEQLPYQPTGVIKSWKENAPHFRKRMQIAWKVLQMNCNVCYAWCNPKSRQLPSVARTVTMLHFQGATISSGDGSS